MKNINILDVYDLNGNVVKQYELPEWFHEVEIRDDLIAKNIRWNRANLRAGTHCTKTRAEVNGTTRKKKSQKGRGAARHGDERTGIFVGGGVVHGPKPRDYSFKINKKEKKITMIGAIKKQIENKSMFLVDNVTLEDHKTKTWLNTSWSKNCKSLLVIGDKEQGKNIFLAMRNLKKNDFLLDEGFNLYQLFKKEKCIVSINSFCKIIERLTIKNGK